jgi:hypothetical protein
MNHRDRSDQGRVVVRVMLFSAAAAFSLAGCGGAIVGAAGSSPSAATAATTTASSISSAATASATPSPSPTSDVTAAEQAALGLFAADPSVSSHWLPCSNSNNWAACPVSFGIKSRLAELTSQGYFGATGCGEEYISGTQNGLNRAPVVLSGVASSDGRVTVVIQRGPAQPNLTAVMNHGAGSWLAYDLASGTGATASIFYPKPNC